jgi:catechol 2,3-dioxygenase-like lactoylglutathione lyase family enzyme
MKIKSVSGLTCYVKDLERTAEFYEMLGFEIKKREADHITVYSNWFWIDFLAIGKDAREGYRGIAAQGEQGGGPFIYLSVDSVDEVYRELLAGGVKPASEPRNQPWGNREFILRDPDGYNLVIFKRR